MEAALELVAAAGIILDPWQELVFRGACLRRAGTWAAKQIGVCCPRQNGKNAILEARQLAGLFIFGERLQRYTAHLTDTADTAFRRLSELIEGTPWLADELHNVWKANGKAAIELKNGNRIQFRTRTDRAGRGPSPTTLYFDEAMDISVNAVTAQIPSLAAQSMSEAQPQMWYTGSAVDQLVHPNGMVFALVRERGLDEDDETAWFEWSVDASNPDEVPNYDSPEQWRIANPGQNIRISEDWISHEMRSPMGIRGFCVERLGVGDWPSSSDEGSVIKVSDWVELHDRNSSLNGRPIIAFDVDPMRKWSSIAAAGANRSGLTHIELADRRRGTDWIVARLKQMKEDHNPFAIICDQASPARSLIPELEDAGLEIKTLSAPEHADACGKLVDAVTQKTLRHLGSPELVAALKGAESRSLGEAWGWARRTSAVDITPLVSFTLAHWAVTAGDFNNDILVAVL